ncbi:MAG TPA: DNA gyrase subunit A [Anaerolineaceae bacterium]|nr:DNA gyrase subunit A [Anaerolineaceae bacterium]
MDSGSVQSVDIDQQMRSAYLDYAMSVIVARALPDARDGLKPVHRRILYAMHDMGLHSTSAHKKSARIVGEVLGKYHPHGDSAVYDAMARMAQDFSMRYPFVDGQGNFGSVDGDAPAAMRYTEARLAAIAGEMLADIDKDTVDFTDNFDASLKEPVVLPARLPNLLLNGTSGIAVGMATNIPPHNLRELCAALVYLIDNYQAADDVTVEDLMRFLPGPDFPTGGQIIGEEGISQAYAHGRGRLVVRGVAEIRPSSGGRSEIIIREIPYQVNKTGLIERIAELVREGRIEDITDLRDESDRMGMRIVLEVKKGAQPQIVLNQLYKYTPLQSTFGVQMLALVNGEPRTLPLKKALQIYLDHRQVVITRRSEFELEKARQRAHILEGLLIALEHLDAVIDLIRKSPDANVARERLMSQFKLSDAQAQAILDLQLRRLAALERQKIEDEHKEMLEKIAYLEDLLAHPEKILGVIREDLLEVSEKYGDKRRTQIMAEGVGEFSDKDLTVDEPILITLTAHGYIKRVDVKSYRLTRSGRRGVSGQAVKEEDEVLTILHARTLETILFFSDRGKVYSERAKQIPDAKPTDKGVPVVNLLTMEPGERITAALAVAAFEPGKYCTFATLKGRVKRIALSEFASVRSSGMIAMGLDDDDELGWARQTSGKDDILLVTARGQALRIEETTIRPTGRTAAGVTGIKLAKGDRVASMEVVEPDGSLFVITTLGFGKRTPLNEYPVKGRATGGVSTFDSKNLARTGEISAARVVQEADEVTCISSAGMVLRLKVADIRLSGRATRGSRLMDVKDGDTVASLARLTPEETVEENGAAKKGTQDTLPGV